jgi:hypothetical protein
MDEYIVQTIMYHISWKNRCNKNMHNKTHIYMHADNFFGTP